MECQEPNNENDVTESPETATKVTFDDVLNKLGQFGSYQRRIYLLIFLPTIFCAMHNLAWVFLGVMVPHRCRLPEEPLNSTYDQEGRNLSDFIPYNDGQYSQCSRYDGNFQEIPCDNGWIYDRTTFDSSAVVEWNLVCNELWMKAAEQSFFMTGALIGSFLLGKASDIWGRKPTLIFALGVEAFFGTIAGVIPNYWGFVFSRMMVGMATSGIFVITYVLGMEMVGPDYRYVAGSVCQYFDVIGYFGMALVAYYLSHDWRLMQIVLSAPSAIFIAYWWFIPESVRWLIRKGKFLGRFDECKEIIKKISLENGTKISEKILSSMFETMIDETIVPEGKPNHGFRALMRQPQLRKNAIIMFYIWFVTSGTYFGLLLSSPDLGGNPYLNFVISAAVEVPAYTIVLLILNKFGRKIPLSVSFILAGLTLVVAIFVDESNSTVLVILSMVGKLSISISFCIIHTFSAELFPTSTRSLAVGLCYLFARLGGILCPFLNLIVNIWRPLPLIAYGAFAISAGLLSLMLPETLGKQLPETIAESSNLGKKDIHSQLDEVSC